MGPLEGVKIIELAGIGPCPMCGMLLAELGADILKIDRVRPSGLGLAVPAADAFLHRSRRSIALDLKRPEAAPLVLQLCEHADALIEGFRPGVTEKLGIGPDTCLDRNPRLVYGRMTGWGQEGPLAQEAGHDILELAIGWLASQTCVASVIAGATSPEQVCANVDASGWRLGAAELARVDAILASP